MARGEAFFGSILILVAAVWAIDMACLVIIDHPNWWGISLAIGDLGCGLLIIRSIWRDRL
jgi:hypothetical protein